MKRLRAVLSIVLWPLQVLFGVLFMLFAKPIPWVFARLTFHLRNLFRDHFYWPVVVGRRWIAGVPTWKPIDLLIGQQPRTDADRARAEQDNNVLKQACFCEDPDCAARKNPLYAYVVGAKQMPALPDLETLAGRHIELVTAQQEISKLEEQVAYLSQVSRLQEKTINVLNDNVAEREKVVDTQRDVLAVKEQVIEQLRIKADMLEKKISDVRETYSARN